MKKILVGLVLVLMAFVPGVWAGDFDFSIRGTYSIYNDKDLKGGAGAQAELSYKVSKPTSVYLWGSWERAHLKMPQWDWTPNGDSLNVDLLGIGGGVKYQLFKSFPLKAFGEVGYYIPETSKSEVTYNWNHLTGKGGTYGCSYSMSDGVGGTLGLEYDHHLYKGTNLSLVAGYRVLHIREQIQGPESGLRTKDSDDFGGPIIRVGLTF